MRDPEPDERIEAIFAQFFAPPPITETEYELTLRYISEIMSHG